MKKLFSLAIVSAFLMFLTAHVLGQVRSSASSYQQKQASKLEKQLASVLPN